MKLLRILMMLAVACCAAAAPSMAGDPAAPVKIEKRQLLVPRKGENAEPAALLSDPVQWVRERQQAASGAMTASLRAMRADNSPWAAWTLVLLSFGYGVLHAAGPGHGKAVISAWLLATESELKRGVFIAFLSSIVQALAAIAIVSAALFVFSGAAAAARNAAGVLESASYALIGAMGLYLVWSAFRPVARVAAPGVTLQGDYKFELAQPHHRHGHDHDHANCGHAHGPEPAALRGDWSLAKALSMSLAIGIRPCTGAILVLLAAYPVGLFCAGIVSAFAMAAGTFITVSSIAALTVYSKKAAVRLAGAEKPWMRRAGFAVRVAAGAAVASLGGLLFWASLGTAVPAG
jgi:nickel/cobalt transporter (NicO) family protein